MLKFYLNARETGMRVVRRLVTDQRGVVSFEYVIVATLVVGAVGLAFTNGATGIQALLTTGFTDIQGAFATAIAG